MAVTFPGLTLRTLQSFVTADFKISGEQIAIPAGATNRAFVFIVVPRVPAGLCDPFDTASEKFASVDNFIVGKDSK